jgi:hypothetical protein
MLTGMGRTPRPSRLRALAALSLAGTGVLAGCQSSPSASTTTLRDVSAATVVHPDGSSETATDGTTLGAGDVVRTDPHGHADLVTGDRTVSVESDAVVAVVDAAHQQLRHGSVVVDALAGPALRLDVAGLAVTTPTGAAVRADRFVTIRIGALAGHADIVSDTGRRLRVDALYQAMAGGGDALPDTTTPLQLTDDAAEAHAVPELVRDDETLDSLARGIDEAGGSPQHVVTTAWTGQLAPAPPRAAPSERVLPAVIATAGPTDGQQVRYQHAVADRRAGGSWGVVAHLVGVQASAVVDALAAAEKTARGSGLGSAGQILAAGQQTGPGPTTPRGGGSGTTTPSPTDTGSGQPKGGGGGGGGGPTPTPSPTPSPSPSSGGGGGLVGGLLGVVPTASPTPSSGPLLHLGG